MDGQIELTLIVHCTKVSSHPRPVARRAFNWINKTKLSPSSFTLAFSKDEQALDLNWGCFQLGRDVSAVFLKFNYKYNIIFKKY